MKSSRYTINAIILCILSCTTLFAQETYEVSFTVDLSVQETAGIFDASSQIPRVTGNFAGWATTQAPSLTNTGNGIWSATLEVTTDTSMSKLEYKFILTRDDGGVFWEYAFNTSTSNREYAFTGSETDSDSDGKKEIALSHYFNDFEPEVLNNR